MHNGQHSHCKECGKINLKAVDEMIAQFKYNYGTEEGRQKMKAESKQRVANLRPMRTVGDWIERGPY